MDFQIKDIKARQLIDMACRPMVEVDVYTETCRGTGSAPTGKSVGAYEAFVLRDNNLDEYDGLSVHKAVEHVNQVIAPRLIGQDVREQAKLDHIMIDLDGTEDKRRLGGNAIYSTSIALMRAAAATAGQTVYEYIAEEPITQIPVPSFNMINGGQYGTMKQSINEFIVMPWRAGSVEKAVEIAVRTFQEVGKVITEKTGKAAAIGRSYGWVAPSEDPEYILDILSEALERLNYRDLCSFALDCAANEMYNAKTKRYYMNGEYLSTEELINYYKTLTAKYDFIFVEDMLDENDWDGFALAHKEIKRSLIIADDFTVSNQERIEKAHAMHAIDGFILKPNQVGTLTEALAAHRYAKRNGLISTPSGRSGGVIDDIIMDLAVGLKVPFLKNGCPRSGERIEKLNFLMRVNDRLKNTVLSDIRSIVRFEK